MPIFSKRSCSLSLRRLKGMAGLAARHVSCHQHSTNPVQIRAKPLLKKKRSLRNSMSHTLLSKRENQSYLEENACGWNRHCVQESGNLLWINTFWVSTSVISVVHEEHMISIIRVMLNLRKKTKQRAFLNSSALRTKFSKDRAESRDGNVGQFQLQDTPKQINYGAYSRTLFDCKVVQGSHA